MESTKTGDLMNSTSTNLFIYCLMFDMLHFLMESEFLSTNN